MDFTWQQIFTAAGASVGFIGGLIAAIVKVQGLIEARRKRLDDGKQKELHSSVESRRLELEFAEKKETRERDDCWKLVDEKNKEIASLKAELEESEKHDSFARPKVTLIYKNLRLMEDEINHLNVMIMSESETNVFMRRFAEVKRLMAETRDLLP